MAKNGDINNSVRDFPVPILRSDCVIHLLFHVRNKTLAISLVWPNWVCSLQILRILLAICPLH